MLAILLCQKWSRQAKALAGGFAPGRHAITGRDNLPTLLAVQAGWPKSRTAGAIAKHSRIKA